jgi:magnesium-transporting ATPase (P-type)
MVKSFITLAYISNIMVGSSITPIQKQNLLKMVRNFIGEGEYAAAIVTNPEDQFMIYEADLCANLKTKGKSADFEAVVDVSLKDFSAISYLLFKHGNQIQMRLSKAAQAFFYRSLMTFLIVVTYMTRSGFSGSIPFTSSYYFGFTIFISPIQILFYAILYKDYGYDYFYRIYGHYKYNFSFTLVETEYVIVDYIGAFCDWLIIYMPFEVIDQHRFISIQGGRNVSVECYNTYQVILMQLIFLQYFRNTNIHIIYSHTIQVVLTVIGICLIFDDDRLVGVSQLFTCPAMMLILLFQILFLELRNQVSNICSNLVIKKYSSMIEWYIDIEERLAFEEYEDINQTFSIQQNKQLYKKINSSNIQRTLTLINTNMMKCPKTDGLEQILENINIELDNDRRG